MECQQERLGISCGVGFGDADAGWLSCSTFAGLKFQPSGPRLLAVHVRCTVVTVLQISINPSAHGSVVRQIADALRVELVHGRLQPGDELPSVRRAAIDLNLHFNTVAEAYRQLAAEGWLDLKHGRSARVAHREQPKAKREAIHVYRQRLRELLSEMSAEGVQESEVMDEFSRFYGGKRT